MNGDPGVRTYSAILEQLPNGGARVPVPFDPNDAWGSKREHHIGGTIAGRPVRGSIVPGGGGWCFSVGASWLRDGPAVLSLPVRVRIAPEGPQRADLAPDIAAALDQDPAAGAFFDALAQFYRKGYLRWIEATKRRPEVRAERIAEVIELLAAGNKERPKDHSG